MSVELFDTHAHLHFPEFAPDLDDVLARARAAGVRTMVTIGTDGETSRAAVAVAERDPEVWAAVGLHPHDAAGGDDALFAELERLAAAPRVVALGEMGLDFFRNLSPRPAQELALRRQLALARRLRKPALIHCRDAHEETLTILAEERVSEVGGIMHCFSGDPSPTPTRAPCPTSRASSRPIDSSWKPTARSCRRSRTVAGATSRRTSSSRLPASRTFARSRSTSWARG